MEQLVLIQEVGAYSEHQYQKQEFYISDIQEL